MDLRDLSKVTPLVDELLSLDKCLTFRDSCKFIKLISVIIEKTD